MASIEVLEISIPAGVRSRQRSTYTGLSGISRRSLGAVNNDGTRKSHQGKYGYLSGLGAHPNREGRYTGFQGLADADEIALLEGGVNGYENDLWGNSISGLDGISAVPGLVRITRVSATPGVPSQVITSSATGGQAQAATMDKVTVLVPTQTSSSTPAAAAVNATSLPTADAKAVDVDIYESIAQLSALIGERRAVVDQTRQVAQQAIEQVKAMDAEVQALKAELDAAPAAQKNDIAGKLVKTDRIRTQVATRASQAAKTNALARLLTKNALTQFNFLELAKAAIAIGDSAAAAKMTAAAVDVGRQSAHLKELRQEQIARFDAQVLADEAALVAAKKLELDAQEDTVATSSLPAETKSQRKMEISAKRSALASEKPIRRVAQVNLSGYTRNSMGMRLERSNAALAGLDGWLDDLWSAVKSIASTAYSTIKDIIDEAQSALVSILKKGACSLATNPTIKAAVASIAAGASGGVTALVQAGASAAGVNVADLEAVLAKITGGGCPIVVNPTTGQAMIDPAVFKPDPTVAKKPFPTAAVVGGGVGIAAILALILL